MSWKLIEFDILTQVVADQRRIFVTKDVYVDKRMLGEQPKFSDDGQYHISVGRALSEHHDILGIVEIQKKTSGGSRWEKLGLAKAPQPRSGRAANG